MPKVKISNGSKFWSTCPIYVRKCNIIWSTNLEYIDKMTLVGTFGVFGFLFNNHVN